MLSHFGRVTRTSRATTGKDGPARHRGARSRGGPAHRRRAARPADPHDPQRLRPRNRGRRALRRASGKDARATLTLRARHDAFGLRIQMQRRRRRPRPRPDPGAGHGARAGAGRSRPRRQGRVRADLRARLLDRRDRHRALGSGRGPRRREAADRGAARHGRDRERAGPGHHADPASAPDARDRRRTRRGRGGPDVPDPDGVGRGVRRSSRTRARPARPASSSARVARCRSCRSAGSSGCRTPPRGRAWSSRDTTAAISASWWTRSWAARQAVIKPLSSQARGLPVSSRAPRSSATDRWR